MESTFQFNGFHFIVVLLAFVAGFAAGAIYGFLLRDESDNLN